MVPHKCLYGALKEEGALEKFGRLDGRTRVLVLAAVRVFGWQALLCGSASADPAVHLVTELTASLRLGRAVAAAAQVRAAGKQI